MKEQTSLQDMVRHCYHGEDINCARTTLRALSQLFSRPLPPELDAAGIGMHGAGRFRAQCGLVEGTLMFMGVYFRDQGLADGNIADICREFAEGFTREFGSISCRDLRPGGFRHEDPPHLCEGLTVRGIAFSREFIMRHC